MQQLKPVDVVIAGGGFVGLTHGQGNHRAHFAFGRRARARPAAQNGRLRRRHGRARLRPALSHDAEPGGRDRHAPAFLQAPAPSPSASTAPSIPAPASAARREHWGAICYRFYPEVFTLATLLPREVRQRPAAAKIRAFRTGASPTRNWSRITGAPSSCWASVGKSRQPAMASTSTAATCSKARARTSIPTRRTRCPTRHLVREGGARAGLSSLSGSHGHAEPKLHQSRRRLAAGLRSIAATARAMAA